MQLTKEVTELYGPFLDTTWNQCHPYNLHCPVAPGQSDYYGHRAPVGCVPTAFAQVLNFHCWPPHGMESHTYTDNKGDLQGVHSATFSDSYDWENMIAIYTSASNVNSVVSEEAVSELMYELGVTADANYNTSGTSSSVQTLGRRLPTYFYFEGSTSHYLTNALITSLEVDLRAGFPAVVSIPGHAIVADGLMVDNGITSYHFNYGWGGQNDGWYTKDNINGNSLDGGETGFTTSFNGLS